MTEHIREEQLALYASEDLAPKSAAAIAVHVENCEECQTALSRFRKAHALLTSALIDPSADDLFEVRERVATKLRERRSWAGRSWGGWAAAAGAVIALVLIGIENKPAVAPKPLSTVTYVPYYRVAPKPPQVRAAVLHKPRVRHRTAGIQSVDLIARADQPVFMKMTTADPNVVILWQSNEGMKSE